MENTELMALAVLVESYTMAGVAANVCVVPLLVFGRRPGRRIR